MFTENVTNTICPHGVLCVKWGCARKHPEGRYVGFDCQHDGKCNQTGCQLHHSNPGNSHPDDSKNTLEHKAIIAAIMNYWIPELTINQQVCHHHLNGTCSFGNNCFRRHIEPIKAPAPAPRTLKARWVVTPDEPKKKSRVGEKQRCSVCQLSGHNSRGCWSKKIKMDELPAPPSWL